MLAFRPNTLWLAAAGLCPALALGSTPDTAQDPSLMLPGKVERSLSDPQSVGSEALRLLDEQRRRDLETQNEQRLRQLQRQPDPRRADQTPTAKDDSTCWPVAGLALTGNSLLGTAALRAQVDPLMSGCMSVDAVNRVLAALTGAYVKAGYITARPYLADMPDDGGTLDIQMIEGFVESIEITDATLPVSLAGAFPGLIGRALYLPDLEQGLDQLNRLGSNDFTVDIVAGTRTGASQLVIRPRQGGPRWRIASRLSNSGSDTSGRHSGLLNLSLDSPLHINDLLSLTYVHTLDGSPGYSQQANVFYQVPYGSWTLDASFSDIRTRSILGTQRYVHTQNVETYGFKLDRSLWRDQFTLVNASVRLDHKSSQTTFQQRPLNLAGSTLTVAEAGLSFTRMGRSQWSGYLGYAQGLGLMDADRRLERTAAVQPRFEKYLASLSQTTWFALPGMPLQWRSDLNLQYSPDRLPDLEQLRLAGNSSVRGYRLDGQSVSKGAVLRNTLQTPLRLTSQLSLTPSAGLDAGWGQHSYGQRQTQSAMGASLGASLGWRSGHLRMDYQQGLQRRSNTGTEPGLWMIEATQQF